MLDIFHCLLAATLACVVSGQYYGVELGDLKNNTFGISGKAFLVNASTIQIINYNLKTGPSLLVPTLRARFAVSSKKQVGLVEEIFEVESGKNGFEVLKPGDANQTEFENARLVIRLPEAVGEEWQFFGIVSEEKWAYLAAVALDKLVPKPFCCLPPINGWIYNVKSDPIEILDVKTLRIPNFSFDGNKPPDGWFFVGNGAVDKRNGQKCTIKGRDTRSLQCPMREKISRQEFIVELPGNLTMHDVSWLSVYCYEVGVDFGHTEFKILKNSQPLPAVIPPLSDEDTKALEPWPVIKFVAVPDPGKKFTEITFTMGPTGGARAKPLRGTCENMEKVWYVQGLMQPEIWFQRGATYRFKIFGGKNDPLYFTSDKAGGQSQKTEADKKKETVYFGDNGEAFGDLCSYHVLEELKKKNPDTFVDFDEYSHFLNFDCPNRQKPFLQTWVADTNDTNDFYYGSFNQYYLGNRVRLCDKIEGSASIAPKCVRFKRTKQV